MKDSTNEGWHWRLEIKLRYPKTEAIGSISQEVYRSAEASYVLLLNYMYDMADLDVA